MDQIPGIGMTFCFNATMHSKLSSESAERADDYLGILSSEKLVSQAYETSSFCLKKLKEVCEQKPEKILRHRRWVSKW